MGRTCASVPPAVGLLRPRVTVTFLRSCRTVLQWLRLLGLAGLVGDSVPLHVFAGSGDCLSVGSRHPGGGGRRCLAVVLTRISRVADAERGFPCPWPWPWVGLLGRTSVRILRPVFSRDVCLFGAELREFFTGSECKSLVRCIICESLLPCDALSLLS